jgi:hypothetical protein
MNKNVIKVQGKAVTIITRANKDYISLTDIAKYRNQEEPFSIINNWMRNRATIEFLGLWEKLNNPDFKPLEFERFKNEAGSNQSKNTKHKVHNTDFFAKRSENYILQRFRTWIYGWDNNNINLENNLTEVTYVRRFRQIESD